ncbi:MAG: hypothetical protein J6U92_07155, partial [Clostridia bacterium]|nr:hypothetical protein [Clostridia bacterium]
CAINKRRYEKLVAQRAKLTEDKTSAEQILNGNLVDEKVISIYQDDLAELNKLDERIENLNADLEALSAQNLTKSVESKPILNVLFYVIAILGVVGGMISLFIAGFDSVLSWLDVGVFMLMLSGKLTVDVFLKPNNNQPTPQYLEIIERKKEELVKSESRARELDDKINAFINTFNLGGGYNKATSLDYILQIYRVYARILTDVKQVDLELAELETEKSSFLVVKDEPESLEQLNLQLKAVQNEYTRKSIELANKQASMKAHQEIAYSYAELESKKAELGEKIKQYEEDFSVLNLTAKYLKTADENLKIRYRAPLQESLNKYYKLISSLDKSVQIDVDLNVTVEETGGQRVTDYYSKGYQNLFEICKRFALTDVLFTGEKPFIILDDPFYNLDDKKIEKALALVKELSNEYQIIYLVCHESRAV